MVVFAAEVPVIESSSDSNVHRTSGNMGDVASLLHSFANWSMPASGVNAHSPSTTQFTIFYNGNICVYEGIPAEKNFQSHADSRFKGFLRNEETGADDDNFCADNNAPKEGYQSIVSAS
ncbi:putative transcription factor TIFY family [Lupinus albus]|uniref:Putative transcription factor TIFY family n=1 Tax=Lupinus albus TaxID=3870 RepID=A0A6A4PJ22_LUPAL|nr:putative transcription factor TIFY family [Lupinus albus]